MDIQANGICIGTRPWHENDRMLKLFCEDGNLHDVLARGASKPKYKLKFAAQLFSACDYFLCPSKAGYYILGGATFGALSFLGLSSDPEAYAAACVVCEIVRLCVVGENKRLYAETVAALGELNSGGRADLVVLRMLLAAFSANGLIGDISPVGERGILCRAVLDADVGNVSQVQADSGVTIPLIKACAGRFATQFDKLNSLSFFTELYGRKPTFA